MKIYCHLFVQIADYLALAFHMLSTIPTEKLFIHGNSSNGIIIPSFRVWPHKADAYILLGIGDDYGG